MAQIEIVRIINLYNNSNLYLDNHLIIFVQEIIRKIQFYIKDLPPEVNMLNN